MSDFPSFSLSRLSYLLSKIQSNTSTPSEMSEYLSLIQKSGPNNWTQLQNYVHSAGYQNVDAFRNNLNQKQNQEIIDGLVKIGLAILVIYGIAKLVDSLK